MTDETPIDPADLPEELRQFLLASRPTGPVLSGSGALVLWLMLPAVVPGLSVLFGPALLLAAVVHRARGYRLPWDRGIARLGLAVAAFSIGATVVAAIGFARAGGELLPLGQIYYVKPNLTVQIAWVATLIFSVILHECAHGAAARISGDPTAKERKRLTLNPVPHIDLVGSIILPVVMIAAKTGMVFGWAKPVPVSPSRFRRPRLHNAFVSVAGIATNVTLSLLACGLLLLTGFALKSLFADASIRGFTNLFAPVRIDGVPGAEAWVVWIEVLRAFILVNLVLATLNLLPIPPLDGFHILGSVLPASWVRKAHEFAGMGMIILIALMASDAIRQVFLPAIHLAYQLGALPGRLLGLP